MPIQVEDETSPLKKVLLHRPGAELEQLTPQTLEELLFDDIPYLAAAQSEHDCFAQVLAANGADVLYVEDLVAQTLRQSVNIKEQFLLDFLDEAGPLATYYQNELLELLLDLPDEKDLVLKTMSGVKISELADVKQGPLVKAMSYSTRFVCAPIPNLYFTRDPFASIGAGVSMNRMFSATRNRETLYSRYILHHHPDFCGTPFYYQHNAPYSIEGGDILNLSPRLLAVGLSQRTSPEAVELLAHNIFADAHAKVDTILALDIPNVRAYMHLDTVFTQVDKDKFTIHPGILYKLDIYILRKRNTGGEYNVEHSIRPLEQVLSELLGLGSCLLLHCGGQDSVASAREQWNDGANTLCLAPGVVVVYDRNTVTNRILRENGVTVLSIPSSELSRGRGGPRCMSMPLQRQYT